MSIATYSDLVTAGTEWLGRDGDTTLIARLPDFITLAEAKFNRALHCHQMEKRATTSVNLSNSEPEFISLPTDFQAMRRLRLSSVSGKPHLGFRSGAQADEYRTAIGNVTGQPAYFTILGDELELIATPDQAYMLEMVYRAYIPALTSSNQTNWLLIIAPDLYLYGMLLESAPYIKEDERIAVWSAGMSSATDSLNDLSRHQTYNSGPLVMSVGGPTP